MGLIQAGFADIFQAKVQFCDLLFNLTDSGGTLRHGFTDAVGSGCPVKLAEKTGRPLLEVLVGCQELLSEGQPPPDCWRRAFP